MTYIKKISMTGFKSFGDRTVSINLSSGFTCIVGPNGAGKSNIIDALCFALGRLSKKTMRAKSLEDLIFAGAKGKNPSQRASVTIYFDNSERIFPGDGDTFQITRTIKRGGGGGYKMNGKKTTRQQILNALAAANIDPDGSNQFVLQGKIVELTHMNAEERRKFIEELIGLQKYDEMKDATLKELERAERDLGQFEAIFKEVSAQLKKVEKEKNDALAWRELDDKIKLYNAQLIALRINKFKEEESELEKSIEETIKNIENLKEKITRQEEILKQENLAMENIQKTINMREKEREEIIETITQLKTELSSIRTTLEIEKQSIEEMKNKIKTLEKLQMVLEEGQTFESLIEQAELEIKDLEKQIESSREAIEQKHLILEELDGNIRNNEDLKASYKAEISDIRQQISSNKAQIKMLKESIKKNEEKRKNLELELQQLKGEAESVEDAINKTKLIENDIRQKIDFLKSEIETINNKLHEIEINQSQIQEEKSSHLSQMTELKAKQSSVLTEINMYENNIKDLELRKQKIQKKIEELSQGKDAEEVINHILVSKEKLIDEINRLKKVSKEQTSLFKKYEQDLELLLMKQDNLESEISDNQAKIDNLNT
ncbi:MAG: AAA family ATPase, partial [Promethearchaeota archaeon]